MGAHPFFEIDDAIAAAHEEENPLHTKHRARHDHQPSTINHNKLYDATLKLAAPHNPYLQACDESAVKHGSSQRIPVCSRTSQVAGCRTIHHACMVYSGNQLLLRAGAERSHAGSLAVVIRYRHPDREASWAFTATFLRDWKCRRAVIDHHQHTASKQLQSLNQLPINQPAATCNHRTHNRQR